MRSVVTLITLGVDDLPRARAFYAALGWREASGSSEEIAFLHGIGPALGLWSRAALAEDSGVAQDPGGWGGITRGRAFGPAGMSPRLRWRHRLPLPPSL